MRSFGRMGTGSPLVRCGWAILRAVDSPVMKRRHARRTQRTSIATQVGKAWQKVRLDGATDKRGKRQLRQLPGRDKAHFLTLGQRDVFGPERSRGVEQGYDVATALRIHGFAQERWLPDVKARLFHHFPPNRLFCGFARLDRAAKAGPTTWVEDARLVVPMVQQQTTVVGDDDQHSCPPWRFGGAGPARMEALDGHGSTSLRYADVAVDGVVSGVIVGTGGWGARLTGGGSPAAPPFQLLDICPWHGALAPLARVGDRREAGVSAACRGREGCRPRRTDGSACRPAAAGGAPPDCARRRYGASRPGPRDGR